MPSLTPATRRRTTRRSRSACAAANAPTWSRRSAVLVTARLPGCSLGSAAPVARRAAPCSPEAERRSGRRAPRRIVGHRVWIWFDVNAYASVLYERASEVNEVGLLRPREIRCPTGGREFDESDKTNIHEFAALIGETLDALRLAAQQPGSRRRLSAMYDGQAVSSRGVSSGGYRQHRGLQDDDGSSCHSAVRGRGGVRLLPGPQVPPALPWAPARLRRTGVERSCMTDPNRVLESSANRLRAIQVDARGPRRSVCARSAIMNRA
jgi:hypothetical protein